MNMSQSVHIRSTTTTTTSRSTITLNTGYLTTFPGILKLCQVVLGIVCVGILGHDFDNYIYLIRSPGRIFFFLMVTTFMIATFIQLAAYLSSGLIVSSSIHELLYNLLGFILLVAASATLIADLEKTTFSWTNYNALLAASVIGFINAALYLVGTALAFKSYRGI